MLNYPFHDPFNEYLAKCQELANNTNLATNYIPLETTVSNSIYNPETLEQEVGQIICGLKHGKSPGPDGLRNETLQDISHKI